MTLKSSPYFEGVKLHCSWVILDADLKFYYVSYKSKNIESIVRTLGK